MSPSDRWAVVFGGPSPEHEISILTGLQAERVLVGAGQEVLPLYWAPTGGWFLVPNGTEAKDYLEGAPSGSRAVEVRLGADAGLFVKGRLGRSDRLEPAAALSCLHGGLGEGGGYAGVMALLGVPTTGGSLYASALGMDKLAFGAAMATAGIPTLPRVLLEAEVDPPFDGPYILKPRFGGSSIGIEIADDVAAARVVSRTSAHLRGGAVVEPFRRDLVDLNISFRTAPVLEVSDLERPLRKPDGAVYSYDEKYLGGRTGDVGLSSAPRELPAQVSAEVSVLAADLARRVAAVTGLTGVVRLDFLYSEETGELVVNEVNSVPGALALYLWAPKHPASEVLLDALREARDAPVLGAPSGFGSGAALRAAGGIAGKLVGLDGPRL